MPSIPEAGGPVVEEPEEEVNDGLTVYVGYPKDPKDPDEDEDYDESRHR